MIRRRNREVEEKDYTLPEGPIRIKKSLLDYSMLWHGEKKIGKTLLANEFPGAFFFKAEPGEGDSDICGVDIFEWADFKGYSKQFIKSSRHKLAVLDTVDILYNMCLIHVCKRMGIEHPQDEAYGKGWHAVRTEFNATMMKLHRIGKGPVYIAHSVEKEIESLGGGKVDRIVPELSGQGRSFLDAVVDIWAYFTYDEKDRRVIQIRGDESIAAGHRLQKHFVGVKRILMGDNPQEAYKNFVDAFNNKKGGLGSGNKVVVRH